MHVGRRVALSEFKEDHFKVTIISLYLRNRTDINGM